LVETNGGFAGELLLVRQEIGYDIRAVGVFSGHDFLFAVFDGDLEEMVAFALCCGWVMKGQVQGEVEVWRWRLDGVGWDGGFSSKMKSSAVSVYVQRYR